jgi:hypothetical protein
MVDGVNYYILMQDSRVLGQPTVFDSPKDIDPEKLLDGNF